MLNRYVSDRWVHRELMTNYRTPAEVMELAAAVLATVDPTARPPRSVRWSGHRPWARRVSGDDLPGALADVVRREARLVNPGSVAVIVPEHDPALAGLAAASAGAGWGDGSGTGPPVTVLTPAAAKGLEFDAVIVVEPQRILEADERGAAELYVAFTRATQRLGLIHTAPLPPIMTELLEPETAAVPG